MTSVHVYLCVKLGHGALGTTCLTNGEQSFNGKRISSSSNSIGEPLPLWILSESTADRNGIQFPHAWNKMVSEGRSLSPATPSTKTFHGNMYTEISSSPEEIYCITKNNGADVVEHTWCKFCFKNGETTSFVSSHNLRDPIKNVVQCPVLRAHRCEVCRATGDFAHTRTYCPLVRTLEGNVHSTTIALKSTRRQANGKIRTAKQQNTAAATSLRQKKKGVPCSLTESITCLTAQ